MLLKWFDGREATAAGTALADDVYLQSPSKLPRAQAREAAKESELQKFLQKFLQRVDQAARPLELNVFKRAKFANSFKWRLLEKGLEQELVDELTQALVLRLATDKSGAHAREAAAVNAGRRPRRREMTALLAQAETHFTRGAYPEAARTYEEVLRADPRNAVARVGLGGTFYKQGRLQDAETEVRRALAIRPDFAEAHSNLGAVLQANARYYEAEQSLRRALKLRPAFLDARLNLGSVLSLLGRFREAQSSFEQVLRVDARNPPALIALGRNYALQGDFAEAETLFKRALEIDPRRPRAWAGLVELRKMTRADAEWLRSAEECAASGLAALDEITIRFAIGKYHDDVGDFAHAFQSYRRGNELAKAAARPYDPAARAALVDDLIRVYSSDVLSRSHANASDSRRPVLVTGMPRSGTSLVEQIIAAHPDAHGAGELDYWARVVHNDRAALRSDLVDEALARKLVTGYLRELSAHSNDGQRVIDKTPVNADYLGLIHGLFPNARMIYVRRDPIDTCLSCYFQNFSLALNFTKDLADLADYYRQHHRLVEHWRRALPAGTLLDVPYEELVADQEGWTRRILDFLDLPWDPRCLDFHRAERSVSTASYWQVRQKMYASSVGRWRNYAKFIGPLRGLSGLA